MNPASILLEDQGACIAGEVELGGHITGTNHVYLIAPKDGATIGIERDAARHRPEGGGEHGDLTETRAKNARTL